MLDRLPAREAVGRAYALYDHECKAEVLGTVIACWPERGPTWAVRLHALDTERRPVTVFLYEKPESKLGRWFVTREVAMDKPARYAALVAARKAYDSERTLGLANPANLEGGLYDADEIGPWTRWAGDLDADLMVVGQDWGDVRYFLAQRGLDAPRNPTSTALAALLASIQRPLPPIPTAATPLPPGANRNAGVFLTNALLWLKTGGMSGKVSTELFSGDSATFLLEQIAIVQPRVVIALGQHAHRAILLAFDMPIPKGPFRTVVETTKGISLDGTHEGAQLFGVYHCGAQVRNTIRSMAQQYEDWRHIGLALGSE
jgi:DNA polymerase